MILFIFGIIFVAVVNGQYLVFDGQCPEISPPDESISPEGSFYGIAETTNGTTRSDLTIRLVSHIPGDSNTLLGEEEFRNSDDNCEGILSRLEKVDNGKYNVIASIQGEVEEDSFRGYLVYYLSETVTFICFNQADENKFNAKVIVKSSDREELYSDRQQEVEDLLDSNDLGYLNEYLNPITQDNLCEST